MPEFEKSVLMEGKMKLYITDNGNDDVDEKYIFKYNLDQ